MPKKCLSRNISKHLPAVDSGWWRGGWASGFVICFFKSTNNKHKVHISLRSNLKSHLQIYPTQLYGASVRTFVGVSQ